MAKYMVIETIRDGCLERVYQRFHANGRMLPQDLHYIDSWLAGDGSRCFQLMETDSADLFPRWTRHWDDLIDFEIVEIGAKPQAPAQG